ncbi:MAG TPA: histidine phosphatase family protein, partial [Acidimicrobiales bacterium]|nr:histidine phosphatase family protein [Acidimicrobiales bacterium]
MQRASVTYVRHAMPVSDDGVESTAWHLSDQARRLAGRLASRLEVDGGIGALVSSTEPKAVETAEAIAAHWSCGITTDERLREVLRPWVGNGYRADAHAYLRGEAPDTWETYDAVAERVA